MGKPQGERIRLPRTSQDVTVPAISSHRWQETGVGFAERRMRVGLHLEHVRLTEWFLSPLAEAHASRDSVEPADECRQVYMIPGVAGSTPASPQGL